MANKPAPRNWNDIQVAIATIAMAFTLVFWNLFAGPDREFAIKRAQEQAAQDQAERERVAQEQAAQAQTSQTATTTTVAQPAAQTSGPILFGGAAPQTQIVVSSGRSGGGGGGTGGS